MHTTFACAVQFASVVRVWDERPPVRDVRVVNAVSRMLRGNLFSAFAVGKSS